ncbi:MAG: GNAT family N-acetyltransferase [Candidatus Saccharibacteria bacterium]
MNISELPLKVIELNQGLYITDCQYKGDVIFVTNKLVDDNYWNYAYVQNENFDAASIEDYFKNLGLPPAIYLLENDVLEQKIKDAGFNLGFSDAIMVLDQKPLATTQKFEIKKVSDDKIEKDFLEVYRLVYASAGDDIYSGLSDGYVKNVEDYFRSYPAGNRLDLVAYIDNQPVGVATALFDDEYAFLMNAAVSPRFRKMGVAKDLTNKLLSNVGDRFVLLSTEKDSVNEVIWQKAGFKTVAVGNCYIKP